MTTLRIEVGRASGTTIAQVVEGLRLAGCMKYLEVDPSQMAFLPIDELADALRHEFHVEFRPWPDPPPPTLWQRLRAWPRRISLWTRRRVLGETAVGQYLQARWDAPAIHKASMRESPFLAKMRNDSDGG